LGEDLFVPLATLSEYISRAELADSKFRGAGEMVHIEYDVEMVDLESDVEISSQESTLPQQLDEDDESRYRREEEERADELNLDISYGGD
jgi:hypothetical protein